MCLSMPRPYKNRHGTYVVRWTVKPQDRKGPLAGKQNIIRSLATKDPAEARRRYSDAAAQVDLLFQQARAAPASLTGRQVEGLVGRWYRQELEALSDSPATVETWERFAFLFKSRGPRAALKITAAPVPDPKALAAVAREIASRAGVRLSEESERLLIARLAHRASQLGSALWLRFKGDYSEDPTLRQFPEWAPPASTVAPASGGSESILGLFDAYAKERGLPQRTREDWRRVIVRFTKFIGHDEAARVARRDVVRWKDSLVASGLSPVTINNARLVPIKRVYSWAADNERLKDNPTLRVTAAGKGGPPRRPFTLDEARRILAAARQEAAPFRRWAPWLQAYTGARVGEIVKLRVADVREVAGVWGVSFNPEQGRGLKNKNSARFVPLHGDVLAEGFRAYRDSQPPGGFLFPKAAAQTSRGVIGARAKERLAEWVRSLGIKDKEVGPNHSWRHLLKDLCRECGIPQEAAEVLQGHAPRSVADRYGSGFRTETLAQHIARLPSLCPPANQAGAAG